MEKFGSNFSFLFSFICCIPPSFFLLWKLYKVNVWIKSLLCTTFSLFLTMCLAIIGLFFLYGLFLPSNYMSLDAIDDINPTLAMLSGDKFTDYIIHSAISIFVYWICFTFFYCGLWLLKYLFNKLILWSKYVLSTK